MSDFTSAIVGFSAAGVLVCYFRLAFVERRVLRLEAEIKKLTAE